MWFGWTSLVAGLLLPQPLAMRPVVTPRCGVVTADAVERRVRVSEETVIAAAAAVAETAGAAGAVGAAGAAAHVADEMTGASESMEPAELDARLYSLNKFTIDTVKGLIDLLYEGNDYARFYVLETVARVPYFAYMSMMHLQETMGKRGAKDSERMRTHYAQADNELHHLLIMESLGGNSSAVDRTIAQTMAVCYYWYVVVVFALSEQAAYHLSELVEEHAYKTYDAFLNRRGDELRKKMRSDRVDSSAQRFFVDDDAFLAGKASDSID